MIRLFVLLLLVSTNLHASGEDRSLAWQCKSPTFTSADQCKQITMDMTKHFGCNIGPNFGPDCTSSTNGEVSWTCKSTTNCIPSSNADCSRRKIRSSDEYFEDLSRDGKSTTLKEGLISFQFCIDRRLPPTAVSRPGKNSSGKP